MEITTKQIQLIKMACRDLEIDDDTYREILQERFRVRSSKELSYGQAGLLIDHFRSKGFKIKRKKNLLPKADKNLHVLPTRDQLHLIAFLAGLYPWRTDEGFQRWLDKQADMKRISSSSQIMSVKDASWIIEKLKKMCGVTTEMIKGYNIYPLGCPNCEANGHEHVAVTEEDDGRWSIVCRKCGHDGGGYIDRDAAFRGWNKQILSKRRR